MKYSPIVAIVAMLSFATHSYSQNIVLVNGQASEVTLNGTVITSVISSDVSKHMTGYKEPISDSFKKTKIKIEAPAIVLNKKPAYASRIVSAIDPSKLNSTEYQIVE